MIVASSPGEDKLKVKVGKRFLFSFVFLGSLCRLVVVENSSPTKTTTKMRSMKELPEEKSRNERNRGVYWRSDSGSKGSSLGHKGGAEVLGVLMTHCIPTCVAPLFFVVFFFFFFEADGAGSVVPEVTGG